MDATDLERVLELHARWLRSDDGGRRASLHRVNLRGADLRDVRLPKADMTDVNLRGADLRKANLNASDLRFADLREADLRGASLSGADLRWAILGGANLFNADLSRARLKEAVLDGIVVNWTDRTLISEILWRAAGDDARLRMVAAFVGREEHGCWPELLGCGIPEERAWALSELRKWARDGDGAPVVLVGWPAKLPL
ncbi:MAG: pentapeptide repeat-containing protein [Acidobacteriota bacterium]